MRERTILHSAEISSPSHVNQSRDCAPAMSGMWCSTRAPRTLTSTSTTCAEPSFAITACARCTRITRRVRGDCTGKSLPPKKEGRAGMARPSVEDEESLLADAAADARLAGAAAARIDHGDGRVGERVEVLRLERRRVAAAVVDDRAEREERRAALHAGRRRIVGRLVVGLLDDDEVVRAGERAAEHVIQARRRNAAERSEVDQTLGLLVGGRHRALEERELDRGAG